MRFFWVSVLFSILIVVWLMFVVLGFGFVMIVMWVLLLVIVMVYFLLFFDSVLMVGFMG